MKRLSPEMDSALRGLPASRRRGIAAAIRRAVPVLALYTLPITAEPAHAAGGCAGDCDGNGVVPIAELVLAVDIALGNQPVAACPQYACEPPECVHIALILRAVGSALYGCPATPTATAIEPTATPTMSPDSVIAALEQVIETTCNWNSPGPFYRSAYATEDGYVIDCDSASGHSSRGQLTRFESSIVAALAFADASRAADPIEFHDLPAAYWEIPTNTPLEGADRYLVWQLGCWVVTAHSFDDTHFQIAAQPVPFSNAILAAAHNLLLSQCP